MDINSVSYPLSNLDVGAIANKKLTLVLNPEVAKCKNLLKLFKTDYVLYNYLTQPKFGHWCCMYLKRDQRGRPIAINYFDSYGSSPDETLKYIPKRFREESQQNYPYLLKLLEESKLPLYYNAAKLQAKGAKIATCGRWAGLYLRYCDELDNIDDFGDLFNEISKYGFNKDKAVTAITNKYLASQGGDYTNYTEVDGDGE